MAAKTFQCVICQAEVSKPQSYAYKNGRACRHHPEVQESHNASEQAKKEDLEQSKERAEHPRWNRDRIQPMMPSDDIFKTMGIKDPNKHCWCCHKDGIYEHIVFERFLINISKVELQSSDPVPAFEVKDGVFRPNQQIQDIVRKELGEDKVILRRIEVSSEYPDWKLKQVLNKKNQQDKIQLVHMTGMIVLCMDCAKEYQFPWLYASHGTSKEKLEHMMFVGHLIKPTIDSIAAGEIATEELKTIMRK